LAFCLLIAALPSKVEGDGGACGQGLVVIYSEDFSADPGWATDDPQGLRWDGVAGVFRGTQVNTEGTYAYVAVDGFDPGKCWSLEFDSRIIECGWSAGWDFGLFDQQLTWPQSAGVHQGIADPGRGTNHNSPFVPSGSTFNPQWSFGVWYHHVLAHDSQSGELTLTVTERDSGVLLMERSLVTPPIPPEFTRLGVSRRHMKNTGPGASPSATVDYELDNIVLSQDRPCGCPRGWLRNPDNGHWYRATAAGSWQTAEAEAAGYGAHLAAIDDDAEQAWLTTDFPLPDPYWIGLIQDLDDAGCTPGCEPAGGWGWADMSPLVYQNWAGGEPNNNHPSSEEVGAMNIFGPGRWGDYPNAGESPVMGIIELHHAPPDEAALFRQGRAGYAGTVDTVLKSDECNTPHYSDMEVSVDRGPADHALIRFDDIFGNGASQIPPGSTIISATLSLDVFNLGGISTTLHRMLVPWDCDDTWCEWGDGIQADGVEAGAAPDATIPTTLVQFVMIDVTGSVQAWSNGAANYGWVLLPGPQNDDGWSFASADNVNEVTRPTLHVVFDSGCEGCEPCGCPQGWLRNPDNGHCYGSTAIGTWIEAEAEAVAAGGHLATVRNAAENQWLLDNFGQSENRWIGLVQQEGPPEPDGGWAWSSGEQVVYTNWINGEPNDDHEGEDWVEMKGTHSTWAGQWNDQGAGLQLRGIIEMPCRSNACDVGWSRAASDGPGPRYGTALAYDSQRRVVVLFGGAGDDELYGDTWEWDGTSWTRRCDTGECGPPPRRYHTMVYDSQRGVTVLFGGSADGEPI